MKKLLFAVLSLYALMLAYLYLAQTSFVYFPELTRPVALAPNYELENEGLLLKGWVLNNKNKDAVLYFGGNGESVEHNLPLFNKLLPGKSVYMLSYRGYGNSEGEPTEAGIYSDALALYDKVRAEHEMVSVVGRSLGSGVATYVAANREVDRTVLVTPFASIVGLAKKKFPLFPVELLLKERYLSIERARKIDSKVLVIYADGDQVVPEESTKELIAGFTPEQIEVVTIKGAGHNSISDFVEYNNVLRNYLSPAP